MKKDIYNILLSAFLILAASLLATSCSIHINKREDAGKQVTKTYDVKDSFKGISTVADVDIIYTVSDSVSVKAEGPENYIKHLTVSVGKDSLLTITRTDNKVADDFMDGLMAGFNDDSDGHKSIKVYVSAPALSCLDLKGATEFSAKDTLNVPSFAIHVEGAGEIDINALVTNNFKASSQGASEIKVGSLKSETVIFDTSGASDVKCLFDGVKNTIFTSSGASKADFDFKDCDNAAINISGAGDVKLKGTLRHLDKNVAGAGDIDDEELKVVEE